MPTTQEPSKGEMQEKTAYMPQSQTVEWETPQNLFDELNEEFGFTVDIAASALNAKVFPYFDKNTNSLEHPLLWDHQIVWCNPPYGRQIKDWVKMASEAKNSIVVMLVPARTDTRWFHEYVYKKQNVEVRFIKGRLKFGGEKNNAPFPNMIIIFSPTQGDRKRNE